MFLSKIVFRRHPGQFGFLKFDEQMNLIFAVMLYIMEQSLREENCTMDDIGAYIDTINTRYHKRNLL